MMAWIKTLPLEARALVAIVAGAVAMIMLWILLSILGAYISQFSEVGRLEPRIGRLIGYEAGAEDLVRSRVAADSTLASLAFVRDAEASSVGAELQQVLRALASGAGLTVSGSQLELEDDVDDEQRFTKMVVSLKLEGPPIALDAFLTDLYQQSPALTVTNLDLRPMPPRRRAGKTDNDPERLSIATKVVALKVGA